MAKKRSDDGGALNLDSLMDTVTNVVGVLMIVLIMVSLNIASSINKILSELPPVEEKEYQRLKEVVSKNTPEAEPKKLDEDARMTEQQIKKLLEEVKTLDLAQDKQKVKMFDLDTLTKQIEEQKKKRNAKKSDIEKLLAELDKLKARLDTTPVYAPPPATVVRLPNPRPMPEKAVVQRFLVAGKRVTFLNDTEFLKLVEQEIERNGKLFLFSDEIVKNAEGKPVMVRDKFGRLSPQRRTVYDQKKLVEHFGRLRIGTRDLKLELAPAPTSPRVPMKLTPTPEGGEDINQIKNPASIYQRLIRKFKTEPDTVVWFHVYKDSIDTYLTARELADETGVPVGWDIYANTFYARTVPDLLVNYTPPKTAPPPPPGTPPVITIAPPKTTLD